MLALFISTSNLSAMPPLQDECTFIREKINDLPSIGGEVLIPEGTYECRAPIILDQSHTHLRGQGKVLLRLAKNINAPVIIMGDANTPPRPLQNIQVSDLSIDGNRWYQKMECWGGPCDSGGTSFIRNNGITVRGLTKGRIKNIFITSARSGGVVTERGCYDLIVENLTAVDNEFDGFAGYETVGAQLINLDLSNNRAAGISLDIRFHGNYFQNLKLENNNDVGIFMRDSNSNIFENVRISGSGNHGLFIAQIDDKATCPADNEFSNLTVESSRGFGFLLNNACEGNRLTGLARFSNNRDGCIKEPEGSRLIVEGQVICEE